MSLKKNVLITGATSGIGYKTALDLTDKGYNLYSLSRNKEKFDSLFSSNQKIEFVEVDLNEINSIEKCIVDLNVIFDGAVLCAGLEETKPIKMYKPDKIKSIFDTNFFSNFEIMRTLSLKKRTNNSSSIVVISSIMSHVAQPGNTAYCSSKHAVIGLVKSLALELSSRKIRVNAISPGVVSDTRMTENFFKQIGEESKQKITNLHPLGLGNRKDISSLCQFLLSSESKWITGQNLIIDGGYTAQ